MFPSKITGLPELRAIAFQLAGSDLLRLRVGDYRVLFAVDTADQILRVELIRTRGDVYKR